MPNPLITAIRAGNNVNTFNLIMAVNQDNAALQALFAEVSPRGGESPINCAIKKGCNYVANVLIGMCVNNPVLEVHLLYVVPATNKSLLIYAAEKGETTLVDSLCDYYTEHNHDHINLQDAAGMSALHYAAQSGHTTAVERLLLAGIDTDLIDVRGQTALELATENGYEDCATLIRVPEEVIEVHGLGQALLNLHLEVGGVDHDGAPPADNVPQDFLDPPEVAVTGHDSAIMGEG